jgi:release factor glutamine methyltransferase
VTVLDALRLGTAQLAAAGIESAEHDAEHLLRHLLGWDRARLLADGGGLLARDTRTAYISLVDQRVRRRPLQHLTGTQWFWRHDFAVGPSALIPRPDTEVLVEAALELIRPADRPVVVDVGTGSGCIALSLAAERPEAEVHAVDISKPALALAGDNARRLGLEGRVTFHHGDLLDPVVPLEGRLDLVVSNPPYVSAEELTTLAPEVARHEPRLALVPPGDRLSIYRRLAPTAARLLRPGGALAVEIGQGMEGEVARELEGAGLQIESVVPDLAGILRVVIARRPMS